MSPKECSQPVAKDQSWLGHQCHLTADNTKKWKKYKRKPTQHYKEQYCQTCLNLNNTMKWQDGKTTNGCIIHYFG